MTHLAIVAVGAGGLLAMSSVVALAESSQRGQDAYEKRNPDSYDYDVPLALPPLRLLAVLLGLWRAALLRPVREL